MRAKRCRTIFGAAAAILSIALSLAGSSGHAQSTLTVLADRNASLTPGTQGEVSIAVDRSAPNRIVAAAMNVDDGRLLTLASDDGGESWRRAPLPLPSGAQLHADPMVAFDTRGRAYLAVIPVAPGNEPMGIEILRSDDGGRTWSPPVRISKAIRRDDKVALAVDEEPRSPFRDRIHVAWKWPSGGVFHARSHDGGVTFTRPRLVDVTRASGLDLAVAADGQVFLAASDGETRTMKVWRSSNGGESFAPPVAVSPVRAQWYTSQPSHCRRQSLVHASIAADRSDGARRGWLYLTWADYAAGTTAASCGDTCSGATACVTQVFVARSWDGGRTWTRPEVLPDQATRSDRFFPWIRVDASSGDVFLTYKDTRRDDRRIGTDVYLSRSIDGASSWEAPVRLSSETSDASLSGFQYGDYQGLAVAAGRVYAAWSDHRAPQDPEIFVGRAIMPR